VRGDYERRVFGHALSFQPLELITMPPPNRKEP
jgi:hypothetical protein